MKEVQGFYVRDYALLVDRIYPINCPYKKDLCKRATFGIDNHKVLHQCPRFHDVSQNALGDNDDANDIEWRSTLSCQDVNSISFIKSDS